MSTIAKINFKGNVNKSYVASNVTESSILNKGELETYFQSKENGDSYSYDWTQDESLGYSFTLSSSKSYTIPVNGWIIKNPESYNSNTQWSISVNGHEVVRSDSSGNIKAQFIVKQGDVITIDSSTSKTLTFYPCKSEGDDWRPTDLKQSYDIWKGAVVEVNGSLATRDQYIPDASDWNFDWYDDFYNKIASIDGEEAYDEDGNHLFYIQTYNIENGDGLFRDNYLWDVGWSVAWESPSSYGCTIKSFTGDFSNLVDGSEMFIGSDLQTFDTELPKLSTAAFMFYESNLADWNIDLPELENIYHTFDKCRRLRSFRGNMNNLTRVRNEMFGGCYGLTSFVGDMPILTSGQYLFQSCFALSSFEGNLRSLEDGYQMFEKCSALRDFNSNLESLTDPMSMFNYTRLTAASVKNILDTINDDVGDYSRGIYIGVGYASEENFEENLSSIGYSSVEELRSAFSNKGWSVSFNYNYDAHRYFYCETADEIFDIDSNWRDRGIFRYNYTWSQSLENLKDATFTGIYDNYYQNYYGTYGMFYRCCLADTDYYLTSFCIDLPNLENGSHMFQGCESLSIFSSNNPPKLTNGQYMFYGCTYLSSVASDFPSLTDGRYMFYGCSYITTMASDFPNLTNGQYMFYGCTYLTSMASDFSSVENGYSMFYRCSALEVFSSDMPKLTEAKHMFSQCSDLTSFNGNLSRLSDGFAMFIYCSNLTSFSADLPNLTNGSDMFYWCKLDAASVERILTTIPTYTDGAIHQLTLQFSSSAASKFAAITGVTPTTTQKTVSYKGWTIYAKING